MKPEEIAPINGTTGSQQSNYNPKGRTEVPFRQVPRGQVAADVVDTPQLDHQQFNKLESSNADAQEMARGIRKVNQSLETIDVHLQQMLSSMEGMVKVFPPYPPGSSERIETLRQFNAFRRMIDQVVQPHRVYGVENILGDPNRNPRAGDWQIQTPDGGTRFTIRHQPVHTGPGGLDIPELDIDSDEHQIRFAIQRTSTAIQTLNNRRNAFITDANHAIAGLL